MLRLTILALALFPMSAFAADDDAAKLKGTWVVIAAEADGKKVEGKELEGFAKAFTLTLDGEKKFSSKTPDGEFNGTYTIDATKKLKEITFTKDKGEEVKGIFEFDGEKLKYCSGKPGNDRPTSFTTVKDGKSILLVLEKKK